MNKKMAAVLALLVMAGGCLPISKERVEKRQYVLDVSRPEGGAGKPTNAVLRVYEFSVPQQYEGRGFKYRTDELTFQSDFYNEFFILPGQMIAEETRQWLDESGMFKDVVGDGGGVSSTYTLDGTIQELYGDYTTSPSKAMLAIEFVLQRDVRGRSEVVFKKTYRQEQAIAGRSAKELARGWNDALGSILKEFEKDLREKISKA
jgi:cholesterol transport system auxiliary component